MSYASQCNKTKVNAKMIKNLKQNHSQVSCNIVITITRVGLQELGLHI